MRKTMRSAGRRAAVGAAVLLGVLVAASAAGATTGAGWSSTTAVSNGLSASSNAKLLSYPGGGMLMYFTDADGAPAVASFSGGTLGAAQEVPDAPGYLGNSGTPAQAAVLPNGDAVFSWELSSDSGATWMAYRYANGTWGPAIGPVQGFAALAARSGEVLGIVGAPNSSTVTVDQFTVGSGGTLTPGATNTIYSDYLEGWGAAGISLDANGAAEAVLDTEDDGIVEVQRSSAGAWGAARVLPGTAPTSTVYGASNFSSATAPGGALIASWQLMHKDYTNTVIYAATRQPGGSLSTADTIATASGGYTGTGVSGVTAGGDGTLAVDFSTSQCASTSSDVVDGYGLAVAAPGGSLGSVVPESVPITSLGAGDGDAAAVLENIDTTGFPSGTDPASWPCNGGGPSGNWVLTTNWALDASIVTSAGQQVSSHTIATGVTHNPAPQAGDFYPIAQATGVDSAGNAAFTGKLESSGALDLVTYGSPGATGTGASGTGSGGTGSGGAGSGGTGSGGTGSSGTGGGGSSGSGAPSGSGVAPAAGSGPGTASVARVGSIGAAASVALACAGSKGASCPVDLTLTVVETISGGKVVAIAARSRAKHRTVVIGSLRTTLAAGAGSQLKVPLNAAGRRLLSTHHRLSAHLSVTEAGKLVRGATLTFTEKQKHA